MAANVLFASAGSFAQACANADADLYVATCDAMSAGASLSAELH